MSVDIHDALQEEYYDKLYQEEFENISSEAIEYFKEARMSSYFDGYEDPTISAKIAIARSNKLLKEDLTASYLFAAVSIELMIKKAVIRPIVHGLIHNESFAKLVSDRIVASGSHTRQKTILWPLFKDFMDFDFKEDKRPDSTTKLWNEIVQISEKRNSIVHKGIEIDSEEEVAKVIEIALFIMNELLPKMLTTLGIRHISSYLDMEETENSPLS